MNLIPYLLQLQCGCGLHSYLLYDNAIPVKQNGQWGLYDIKGNLILPIEYDGFGCIAGTSSDKTLNNILF